VSEDPVVELSEEARRVVRLQSYGARPAIDGLAQVELRRFNDEGGSLVELLRTESVGPGLAGFKLRQVNYSCVQPGAIKAFHVHRRQTDVWFVPPEDRLLMVATDLRRGSATAGNVVRITLGDGSSTLLRIPPGVAHGCRNLDARPARLIYFTDLEFSPDPARCDEGRLPWDWVGAEVWELPRE
jgi:dTDP-4-dehydrorhamnose 3,5-epimerase